MEERFVPVQRTAVDGVPWWCVWDREQRNWSTYMGHSKYKLKRDCIAAIQSTKI